eukprot:CAMPEP_0174234394 /NCGR_PEP_ID=MMETSP0417-20130205/4159_1 /TAXON_ID=242541 /ORGANISM="Mayorella sp, Strain BSH-02190019" /LENGTH=240 /DNA_ID=CAMNT_0015312749 /DNA_START=28 /DNA_END=746 /DNA_ORIENTATION=+
MRRHDTSVSTRTTTVASSADSSRSSSSHSPILIDGVGAAISDSTASSHAKYHASTVASLSVSEVRRRAVASGSLSTLRTDISTVSPTSILHGSLLAALDLTPHLSATELVPLLIGVFAVLRHLPVDHAELRSLALRLLSLLLVGPTLCLHAVEVPTHRASHLGGRAFDHEQSESAIGPRCVQYLCELALCCSDPLQPQALLELSVLGAAGRLPASRVALIGEAALRTANSSDRVRELAVT